MIDSSSQRALPRVLVALGGLLLLAWLVFHGFALHGPVDDDVAGSVGEATAPPSPSQAGSPGAKAEALAREAVAGEPLRYLRVHDADGMPVAKERLLVLADEGLLQRRTDQEGVLPLPAGNLLVLTDGAGRLAREVLVVQAEEDDVTVAWPTACSLVVSALDENGDPVVGLPVALALAQVTPEGSFEVVAGPRDPQRLLWKRLLARLTALAGAEGLPTNEAELDAVWRSFADRSAADLSAFLDAWVAESHGARWVGFPYAGIREPRPTDEEGTARWGGLPGGLPVRFSSTVKIPMIPDPYPEGDASEDYPIASGDPRSPRNSSATFTLPRSGVRQASILVLRNAGVRALLPPDFHPGLGRARAVLLAVGKENGSRATRLEGQVLTKERRELSFPVVPPGRKHLVALYPIQKDHLGLVGRFFALGIGESKDLGVLPPEGPGACTVRIVPYDALTGQEILSGDPRLPDDYWRHTVLTSFSATGRPSDAQFFGMWLELRPDTPLRIDGLSLGLWTMVGGVPGFMQDDVPESLAGLNWGPIPSVRFEVNDAASAVPVEIRIPVKGFDYVPVELELEKQGEFSPARRYQLSLYRGDEVVLETKDVRFGPGGVARVAAELPPGRAMLFLRPLQGMAAPGQGGYALQEIEVGRDGRTDRIPVRRGVSLRGRLVPLDGAAIGQSPMASCDLAGVPGLPQRMGSGRGDYVFTLDDGGGFLIVGVPPNAHLNGRYPWEFDLDAGSEDREGLEVPCRLFRSP